MNIRAKSFASASGLAFGLFLASQSAQAQIGPSALVVDESTQGDDIIVTGLRRESRLQDTPASISVVTGESLSERSAVSYRDYLNTVPGVSYVSNGNYKDKIFIRGIAEGLSARTLATTGVYIDEVSLSEVDAGLADVNTFDIERVEVLRGPQGTLYGSGSMGGTVRVITAKPKIGSTEALGETTLSFTRGGGTNFLANAAVNIPVGDTLALRVVGGYRKNAGFVENLSPADPRTETNESSHLSLRAQALFEPVDGFSILASFQYQKDEFDYSAIQDVGKRRAFTIRYPEFNSYSTKIYGLTVNKDLGFADLVSATSYIDKSGLTGRDTSVIYAAAYANLVGAPIPSDRGLGLLYSFPNKAFSQEVRLASKSGGSLNWLLGAYYSNFTPFNMQYFDAVETPGLQGRNLYTTSNDIKRRQYAVFGEISYKLFDIVELTAGYRHTDIKSNSTNISSGVLNGNATTTTVLRSKESAGTQKYRVSVEPSGGSLIYVQAAQGFRAGAPIAPLPTNCAAELQAIGLRANPGQYNADRLWNYEIGSKNSLFGRAVTVNGAIFYVDWKDIQVARNLTCGPQVILNGGRAVSKGFEIEIAARPFEGLDLTASTSHTDTEIKTNNPTIGAVAGDPLPSVPRWTANASVRYEFAMSNELDGFARIDYNYISGRWSDFKGLGLPRARYDPAYNMVGVRIGATKENVEAALFVTNLFDKNAVVNSVSSSGLTLQNIVQPRTVGVNLKVNLR